MTIQDQVVSALTCWRENRGGQPQPAAMQSIMNVILNRAAKTGDDPYTVCTTHAQFSSMTEPGPEDILWPTATDVADWVAWQTAITLGAEAAAGTLPDLTRGSTLYYNPKGIQTTATYTLPNGTVVQFPQGWNPAVVTYQCEIADQLFFTET
jgi:hypothetical protein